MPRENGPWNVDANPPGEFGRRKQIHPVDGLFVVYPHEHPMHQG